MYSQRFTGSSLLFSVIMTKKEGMDMERVRLRIAELRHRKNITQQQLAEIVGVSFQTISKWENGGSNS